MDTAIAEVLRQRLADLRGRVTVLARIEADDPDSAHMRLEEAVLGPIRQAVRNLEFVCEGKVPENTVSVVRQHDINPIDVWMDRGSYGIVEEGHAEADHRTIIVAGPGSNLYENHYGQLDPLPGFYPVATFAGSPEKGTLIAAAVDGKYPDNTQDLDISFLCHDIDSLPTVASAAQQIYENVPGVKVHIGYTATMDALDEQKKLDIEKIGSSLV